MDTIEDLEVEYHSLIKIQRHKLHKSEKISIIFCRMSYDDKSCGI